MLALYTDQVVTLFSILTIVGQVLVLVLVVFLARTVFGKAPLGRFGAWLERNALLLMLVAALAATIGSLFFSEIAGWVPCKLCWIQRIFLYPQVVILAIALWKRDRTVAPYILALSLFGAVFAGAHYIEQIQAMTRPLDPLVPCDTSGTSCASTQIFTFGYITIPLMALAVFMLDALGALGIMRADKKLYK